MFAGTIKDRGVKTLGGQVIQASVTSPENFRESQLSNQIYPYLLLTRGKRSGFITYKRRTDTGSVSLIAFFKRWLAPTF